MSDDEKKLEELTPEEYSNKWYRQRLDLLEALNGRMLATMVDELAKSTHQANAFRKENNELRKDREKDAAKIGELMAKLDELAELKTAWEPLVARMTELEKRMNNASEYIAKLEKAKGGK